MFVGIFIHAEFRLSVSIVSTKKIWLNPCCRAPVLRNFLLSRPNRLGRMVDQLYANKFNKITASFPIVLKIGIVARFILPIATLVFPVAPSGHAAELFQITRR
jgi:hypothetical protein